MPLEFQIPIIKIKNADVKLMELASTAGLPGGPVEPVPSNKLIQTDQPFKVEFEWEQVAGSWMLNGCNWQFDIYLEQMGPGEAPPAGGHFTGNQAVDPTNGVKSFTKQVGAYDVAPGLYRVTVCQQLHALGQPRAVVMFGDIGLVRFYEEN